MIRVQLLDGQTKEIPRESVRLLVAYRPVLRSPVLKSSISGVFCYEGKPIPVYGPLPEDVPSTGKAEDRAWILLTEDGAHVIRGLPYFLEDATLVAVEESTASAEESIDPSELLKSA